MTYRSNPLTSPLSVVLAALSTLALGSVSAAAAPAELTFEQVGDGIAGAAWSDEVGNAVAASADGMRIALSAALGPEPPHGVVRIYDWDGVAGTWVQAGPDLVAQDQVADNRSAAFGAAIALSASGHRIAIGAPGSNAVDHDEGLVAVYEWDGTSWVQVGDDMIGRATSEVFGEAVAISSDGNRVVAGGAGGPNDGWDRGRARVYDWDGTAWVQLGADIEGDEDTDQLGYSVAISDAGSRVAVGMPEITDPQSDPDGWGEVRVFDWDGASWTQVGDSIIGDVRALGWSVAMSGDGSRIVAGDNGLGEGSRGRAVVYDWDGSNWVQVGSALESGWSVDMAADGSRVIVGAPARYSNVITGATGGVVIYDWEDAADAWTESRISGRSDGDAFGSSVALSRAGDRAVIGAPWRGWSEGLGYVGEVTVFDLAAAAAPTTTTTNPPVASTLPETGTHVVGRGTWAAVLVLGLGGAFIAMSRMTRRRVS